MKKKKRKERWPYIPPSMKKVTYYTLLLNYLYSSIKGCKEELIELHIISLFEDHEFLKPSFNTSLNGRS
jgi:hypothetical protein